ncbi:hypothetical protein [Bradyrhizobium prioriisuperbiae]|uniref:hypothetical protein n=1 Tax=Bradyrhizobium prioriisuperbiae TaxID=2854389 RepID=UPI0028E5152D|nr:hypothetical protein [Bradyrhizobium prioritasuperba]
MGIHSKAVIALLCVIFSGCMAQPSSAQQRVILYEEEPGKDPIQSTGTVKWRTQQMKSAPNFPMDLAIVADVEIPARKLKLKMSVQRNLDLSLPASHTAELKFDLPRDFKPGGIQNAPGILVKPTADPRGTALKGLAVKVNDKTFLVGFSNVAAERQQNIQLLKDGQLFEIPLAYANGRNAIISLEKGPAGKAAIEQAFQTWKQ